MSTTLNDEHWLNLITQYRSSGLTDRQWCIENGVPCQHILLSRPGFTQKNLRGSGSSGCCRTETGSCPDPTLGKGTAFRYRSFTYALDLSGNAGHAGSNRKVEVGVFYFNYSGIPYGEIAIILLSAYV